MTTPSPLRRLLETLAARDDVGQKGLVEICKHYKLVVKGSADELIDRVCAHLNHEIAAIVTVSGPYSRNFWNDISASLGGQRRKSLQDIATEIENALLHPSPQSTQSRSDKPVLPVGATPLEKIKVQSGMTVCVYLPEDPDFGNRLWAAQVLTLERYHQVLKQRNQPLQAPTNEDVPLYFPEDDSVALTPWSAIYASTLLNPGNTDAAPTTSSMPQKDPPPQQAWNKPAESQPAPAMALLQVQSGGDFRVLPLSSSAVTLGRLPENDVVLSAPHVSGKHARIEFRRSESPCPVAHAPPRVLRLQRENPLPRPLHAFAR